MTKYEWSLNGTVMATTATYEVPASAKDGDEIKLTVTAEDGETASDTVYVGGLTILKVEPLAQGNSYKFIKAYFSSALTSLSPSEIEIRGKKDQKLYSIQTAVLSTDGMAADLTLYGSNADDQTTFLRAGQTYVMTLTQNGQSTSLEFELPAYATDKIVTSVDVKKNTITTTYSDRTGETGDADTFNVAGKYAGNLGTLIGRTVSYQWDTDYNLTAFSLDDAEVVYGAMKFVNDDNNLETAYFKDLLTGETYKYNASSRTANKNITQAFAAQDGNYFELQKNKNYNYTKLVLNPDGTVSTANIVEKLEKTLLVASVEGTKVIQDKNNTFDLDGFIIVKDDEYVTPADLEVGDVVFLNTTLKFADVYTNPISGELSNVISGKLDIDGTTYTWAGAQYYDDDDEVYKTLSNDEADTEASQTYLKSLDTETDTTIWIARNKDIKYLDGTVVGAKKYTYETYLITKTGKTYEESLKNKFNVDVFDGTTKSTVTIDLDQLKFYKGIAGSYALPAGDAGAWKNNTGSWDFKGTTDPKYDTTGDKTVSTALKKGNLVKFMYDEDGKLVGLSDNEDEFVADTKSSLNGTEKLWATKSPNLKKDSTKLVQDMTAATQDKKIYTMGSYTNLWIWNQKDNDTTKETFTKVVLTDFTNEIKTDTTAALGSFEALTYRTDGTKVVDLVVTLENDDAYADAETQPIAGVMTEVTYKNNDDDTNQIVNSITIYGTDGVKTKYYGDGKNWPAGLAGAKVHDYVVLTQDKSTELIVGVANMEDWESTDGPKSQLSASRAFSNEKLVTKDNIELKTVSGGVILQRYKAEGSTKYKIVDYSDVNVIDGVVNVWYNITNADSTGTKVDSDMIVVEATGSDEITSGTTAVAMTYDGVAVTTGASKTLDPTTTYKPLVVTPTNASAASFSYAWSHSDGATVTSIDTTTNSTVTVNRAGTYTCVITSTPKSGYSEIADVTVTLVAAPAQAGVFAVNAFYEANGWTTTTTPAADKGSADIVVTRDNELVVIPDGANLANYDTFEYAWTLDGIEIDGVAVDTADSKKGSTVVAAGAGRYECTVTGIAKDNYEAADPVTFTYTIKKKKVQATDFMVRSDVVLTAPNAATPGEDVALDSAAVTTDEVAAGLHTVTFTAPAALTGEWALAAPSNLPTNWAIVDDTLNFVGPATHATTSISLQLTVVDDEVYEGTATILFTMTDEA